MQKGMVYLTNAEFPSTTATSITNKVKLKEILNLMYVIILVTGKNWGCACWYWIFNTFPFESFHLCLTKHGLNIWSSYIMYRNILSFIYLLLLQAYVYILFNLLAVVMLYISDIFEASISTQGAGNKKKCNLSLTASNSQIEPWGFREKEIYYRFHLDTYRIIFRSTIVSKLFKLFYAT